MLIPVCKYVSIPDRRGDQQAAEETVRTSAGFWLFFGLTGCRMTDYRRALRERRDRLCWMYTRSTVNCIRQAGNERRLWSDVCSCSCSFTRAGCQPIVVPGPIEALRPASSVEEVRGQPATSDVSVPTTALLRDPNHADQPQVDSEPANVSATSLRFLPLPSTAAGGSSTIDVPASAARWLKSARALSAASLFPAAFGQA